MSTLEARITLQKSRFTLIQEASDFDDNDRGRSNLYITNGRLDMLEQNWSRFTDEHENLCLTESENLSDHPYIRERYFERCHSFYIYARAKLQAQRDEFNVIERNTTRNSRNSLSDIGASSSVMPRSALPRIKLPIFSGDYKEWRSFHDLFTSLIRDNRDLSNVERMHYLKTCVSGEAARLMNNLTIAGENFLVAWNLLTARYENKRILITAQLDRITELKPLKIKSAKGLRNILTTISETTAALRVLGCAVHNWDPLLLHHLVKLLDSETREDWEMKLGSSTSYPTYLQFEEFLLARTRALENISHPTNSERNANTNRPATKIVAHSAASASNTTPRSCPLCDSTHYLPKCERYQNKTASQRKEIVVKHRRCFNCLAPHTIKKCTSTRRCVKCGKKHHTSLHDACREPLRNSTNDATAKVSGNSSTNKSTLPVTD